MRHHSKLALAALTAAFVLASAVSTASARRLEVSNQSFKIAWAEIGYRGTGGTKACPVTMEGSFHSRTISKVSGQLIGYITRAFMAKARCVGGRELYLNGEEGTPNTLPWHLKYDAFTGTLPRITSLRFHIVNFSWLYEAGPSISCLFTSSEREPAYINAAIDERGRFLEFTPEEAHTIPKTSGGVLCASSIEIFGTGTPTTQEGRELIVRLVA